MWINVKYVYLLQNITRSVNTCNSIVLQILSKNNDITQFNWTIELTHNCDWQHQCKYGLYRWLYSV